MVAPEELKIRAATTRIEPMKSGSEEGVDAPRGNQWMRRRMPRRTAICGRFGF
jgi:hypothetical protein